MADSDDNIYLVVDSFIEISNTITSWTNFTLRKVNVKPYECDKMYLNKDLMEDKLYQIIDWFNKKNCN